MSSQDPQLLLATSWILVLKKTLLVVLMIFLNNFQSSRYLDFLYMLRDCLQSLFHHILEYFIILTLLVLVFQACLILAANRLTTCSRDLNLRRLYCWVIWRHGWPLWWTLLLLHYPLIKKIWKSLHVLPQWWWWLWEGHIRR